MTFINRRNTLLLLASGLGGCTFTMEKNIRARSRLVMDDGISEITPVYVMTYTEGQPNTLVRADYYFYDAKKEVELRPGASIKVNGIELQRDPKEVVSYIGDIPMPHDRLTFEFERMPGTVIKHSFVLPNLDVVEFPKTYRTGKTFTAVVNYRPPPADVARDSYGLSFEGEFGRFPFVVQIAGPARLIFKPILNLGLRPESVKAHIYRQQRTPLRNLSSDLQTGWAVASRSRDFTVEVVN
jgi:hypothetical protein